MLPSEFCVTAGWSAAGLVIMARVNGWLNSAIVQADITSIQCTVRDTVNDTVTYNQALTVADVIFNALQTGAIWSVDATGYNFLHTVPATAFPTPSVAPFNRVYVISVRFTPATGQPFVVEYSHTATRST